LGYSGRGCEPLAHQYAGDAVRVVVAIEQQEDGELGVVVTVMN